MLIPSSYYVQISVILTFKEVMQWQSYHQNIRPWDMMVRIRVFIRDSIDGVDDIMWVTIRSTIWYSIRSWDPIYFRQNDLCSVLLGDSFVIVHNKNLYTQNQEETSSHDEFSERIIDVIFIYQSLLQNLLDFWDHMKNVHREEDSSSKTHQPSQEFTTFLPWNININNWN